LLIVPPATLEVAETELVVEELAIAGLVEVTKVDDGLATTDVEEGGSTTTELLEAFLVHTTGALVDAPEVDAFAIKDEGDDTATPALVELAMTELALELLDVLTVDTATSEVAVDFVNAFVVEAGTEEEVVSVTASLVDDEVPLTPSGEARDQNTAGA
jgi:hypothetical protein